MAHWDPWIVSVEDGYRAFYLSGQPNQVPWWKTSWIGAAASPDLKQWTDLGPVLEPLKDEGWESGRLFAGSCDRKDGRYYLFYSAASAEHYTQEKIGLATSVDGLTWQRRPTPLLSLASDISWYGPCNRTGHLHWRDPAVIQDEVSQKYYLYFCASLALPGAYQGGLGLAVADDLAGPYQLLPPAIGPIENANDWPFYHLERPQILSIAGRYHLFFSCFKEFVNPQWLARVGADRVTDSTLYWYIADRLTGPFEPAAELPTVPGSEKTGLYGTQFFAPQKRVLPPCQQMVYGWYHRTYRLAISQEYRALWQGDQVSIEES
ncbi:MAG: family 43 glycosylhydrolase [Leptolyngbya sp. SIO4C1]|nr:family 43 glycosylhydrolase [Leptolyngbya sp. SIO4C1]